MTQQQTIKNPGNIPRFFRLQNCLGRKSSISRNNSKTFWPAELSQPQVISIPERFKDFFARRIVLSANHQYPGNIQRPFCLQSCLSRISSISRKYSKCFSHAELSQTQIINIPGVFKDVFACRNVLDANHQYPENTERLLACRTVLVGSHRFPEIVKDFFAGRVVLAANHQYPENAQSVFRMQNCVSRKSSKSPKCSKNYWPAELCQPHVICIPKKFEDFFACRIVLAANHQYPEIAQSLFRMQNCLSPKSSLSWKYSKTFSPAELSQQQIIDIPEIIKDFSRLQNCLSRKSSKVPEIFKDFLAC